MQIIYAKKDKKFADTFTNKKKKRLEIKDLTWMSSLQIQSQNHYLKKVYLKKQTWKTK